MIVGKYLKYAIMGSVFTAGAEAKDVVEEKRGLRQRGYTPPATPTNPTMSPTFYPTL
jgi:hypothetical protein